MLLEVALLFVLFVMLSAFFSASETAFTTIDRVELSRRADDGEKSAIRIEGMIKRPARLLSAILIGNNMVNAATAALAAAVCVEQWGQETGVFVATVLVTVGLVIFAEILPKQVALLMPYHMARFSVPMMRVWVVLVVPFTFAIKWVTAVPMWGLRLIFRKQRQRLSDPRREPLLWLRHAFEYALDEAEEAKTEPHPFVISAIHRTLHLGERSMREAMIPAGMIIGVSADEKISEARRVFAARRLSRLVAFDEAGQDVVGYLSLKDLTSFAYGEDVCVRDLMRPIMAVDVGETVDDALHIFQARGIHIAVVRERDRTVGMVTLEDLLEAMVGPIRDEHDDLERQRIAWLPNNIVLVAGYTVLRDIEELLDHEFEDDERTLTVAEWAHEKLGTRIRPGESFLFNGIEIAIDRLRGHKVSRIRFKPAARPEPSEEMLPMPADAPLA